MQNPICLFLGSQAEAEEPSQKPQTVGTLHKRSPTTGMYKKFKVAIEGDTLCYADFKEPWRQKPPAVPTMWPP